MRKNSIPRIILTIILFVMSLFFLFPVIWMLANSFKTDAAITADMNSLRAFVPPALNGSFFENYVTVIKDTDFIRYMLNTLFYAAILIVAGYRKRTCGICSCKDKIPVQRTLGAYHYDADDSPLGNHYYDKFPVCCENGSAQYDIRLHTPHDSKPL